MTTTLVPFGARELIPTPTVLIDPATFSYDAGLQANVTSDGRLWATTPVAASSTATNNDTTPGNPPDESTDPYAFPGDDIAT
jgi:putative ATP-grasp target RiPP